MGYDLMLDIEALGTGNNGLITQIGALFFDRYTGETYEEFCENIRIQDALDKGLEVDGGAIKFWLEQPKEVIDKMIKNAKDLTKVLGHFKNFYRTHGKSTEVWSHATFDVPILVNAYSVINQRPPFKYSLARDIRTLVDLAKLHYNSQNSEHKKTHNALDDCFYQVEYCKLAFNALKKRYDENK